MIWAMVQAFRPWVCWYSPRSPTVAMVPFSCMISQMTPAGSRPASMARSVAASVWPALRRTPPSADWRGKMWPGLTRASGLVSGSARRFTVRARSAAEMPVVMPLAASTEMVKAVLSASVFLLLICGRSRFSACSEVMGAQMSPRP